MDDAPRIWLLEYDERFEVFEEFVRYDFEKPCQLPAGLRGGMDMVLVDPPYHSGDCARKCESMLR
jgi:16S rRNA G966 N2-methylase RsmD